MLFLCKCLNRLAEVFENARSWKTLIIDKFAILHRDNNNSNR